MKFSCLKNVAESKKTTVAELEDAWLELSAAEVRELTGEGGKMSFNGWKEFGPLHAASAQGNRTAVEFFLVSKWGQIRGGITGLKNQQLVKSLGKKSFLLFIYCM